ncbi:hypothetical protein NHX12_008184 [Muraenolepis orangiensis]|uniref:Protein kinase domain-containing protein n=1 Tax=Muraenolepis orangiensis TaxID=630683 RepID=A0A9Q0I9J7_9TELE|nr:hypothetical protein NHX12_008184 [Muraenolepis orangiensis]
MRSEERRAPRSLLSSIRVSVSQRLPQFGHQSPPSQPVEGDGLSTPRELGKERTLQGNISVFLPEFPRRQFPAGQDHFEILGFVAKGSFGPILKVKDKLTERTYAVKVLPKSEILKKGVLQQTKEEVIIQRQHKHTFIHNLQDCWQTRRHLFIMCDYCSSGDLYTYWLLCHHFEEDVVRLFAAELGSALGFLHNLGIIHRDVKMENILLSDQGHLCLADFGLSRHLRREGKAFTICGTIQYMGTSFSMVENLTLTVVYSSLCLREPDHCSMLKKVRGCRYDIPETLSSALALLLTELLCKDPAHRLRNLDRFKSQNFFCGTSFDPLLLQKSPVEVVLKLRKPSRPGGQSHEGTRIVIAGFLP